MQKRINVRIYGLWLHENKVLINEENIRGKLITKFPGGGLDVGEGTIDCLKREWKEELGIDIEVTGHFYTTDFFMQSAYDDSQILSIYYWVRGEQPHNIVNYMPNEKTFWKELHEISEETFTLGIDRKVGGMLREFYLNANNG